MLWGCIFPLSTPFIRGKTGRRDLLIIVISFETILWQIVNIFLRDWNIKLME